jgi:hypothetical protein
MPAYRSWVVGCWTRHCASGPGNCTWQTAVVIASNLTAMLSAVNVSRERQEAQAAAGG